MGTFIVLDLYPTTPIGEWGETQNYVKEYFIDYPNNMRQSAFDNSDSFTVMVGEGIVMGHPIYIFRSRLLYNMLFLTTKYYLL